MENIPPTRCFHCGEIMDMLNLYGLCRNSEGYWYHDGCVPAWMRPPSTRPIPLEKPKDH